MQCCELMLWCSDVELCQFLHPVRGHLFPDYASWHKDMLGPNLGTDLRPALDLSYVLCCMEFIELILMQFDIKLTMQRLRDACQVSSLREGWSWTTSCQPGGTAQGPLKLFSQCQTPPNETDEQRWNRCSDTKGTARGNQSLNESSVGHE